MAQIFRAKKSTNKGKVFELKVDSLDHQGRGVGKVKGKVCFVDGALSGETVKAQTVIEKAKLIEAKVVKVVSPSTDRQAAFCQHYGQCGGCQLQHLTLNAQLVEKQTAVTKLFAKFAKSPKLPWQPAIESQTTEYRRSARVACIYDKQNKYLKLGFRAAKSKKIVEVKNCPILSGAYKDIFVQLRTELECDHAFSSVSHVQLCEADNGAFLLLRHTQKISEQAKSRLAQTYASHGFELVWDDGKQPPVYDKLPEYSVLDTRFNFKLDNFIQVNAQVNEKMLKQAFSWLNLQADDQVLDLFCGIGNFSLLAAIWAQRVVGVEGVETSVAMAKQNAQTNCLTNVSFECFDLTQAIEESTWFDEQLNVLILDPSRTGAYEVLQTMPLTQFEKVLYVSCDPVTLARDSALLLQAGFDIEKVGLMNMFPHTGHIETMALFQRR